MNGRPPGPSRNAKWRRFITDERRGHQKEISSLYLVFVRFESLACLPLWRKAQTFNFLALWFFCGLHTYF